MFISGEIWLAILFGLGLFLYQHNQDNSEPKLTFCCYLGGVVVLAAIMVAITLSTGHKVSHIFLTYPDGINGAGKLVMAFWAFFTATACQTIVLLNLGDKQ